LEKLKLPKILKNFALLPSSSGLLQERIWRKMKKQKLIINPVLVRELLFQAGRLFALSGGWRKPNARLKIETSPWLFRAKPEASKKEEE